MKRRVVSYNEDLPMLEKYYNKHRLKEEIPKSKVEAARPFDSKSIEENPRMALSQKAYKIK